MLQLLLGPNEYAKKQYVNSLVKDKGAELVVFGEVDVIPAPSYFLQTDLFSKPKVFLLPVLPLRAADVAGGKSKNIVVVSVSTLDKRKKENKDLISNPEVTYKEFALPHGKELDKWLSNRAVSLGGKITTAAVNELAIRLGRDLAKETKFGGKVVSVEEIYSLEQADNEIKKLISFAQNREISEADIKELVSENGEVDALEITNALAEKDRRALELISKFLKEQTAGDEKGSIIQLNALLSEQFRNVYMVQEFLAEKISEQEILDKTGWKSGRLFVMKKIATRFKPQIISETLTKLAALDEELKTSSIPPKVLLDLILAQLF